MKNIIFTILLVTVSFSQELIVEFQNCSVACETFRIFSDSTFKYKFTGDIYKEEGCQGNIRSISKNKFVVNSFIQPFELIEKKLNDLDSIKLFVSDSLGVGLPAANVNIKNHKDTLTYITDLNGKLTIPNMKIDFIEIAFVSTPICKYFPNNKGSNYFHIRKRYDPYLIYLVDEPIMIEKNKLIFINKNHCLNRVN